MNASWKTHVSEVGAQKALTRMDYCWHQRQMNPMALLSLKPSRSTQFSDNLIFLLLKGIIFSSSRATAQSTGCNSHNFHDNVLKVVLIFGVTKASLEERHHIDR